MHSDPLSIPEILLHVGALLDDKDLVCCVRVCKSWKEILEPLIYSGLDTIQSLEGSVWVMTHMTVAAHASHVRHILIDSHTHPQLLALTFNNLITLTIDSSPLDTDVYFEFLQRHHLDQVPDLSLEILESLSQLALRGHLRGLRSVTLDMVARGTYSPRAPVCQYISNLLTALASPLRYLKLEFGHDMDGTSFLPAFGHHFSTLTHIVVSMWVGDSSRMAQTILSSCPLLLVLSGNKVRALDMMDGKPWACLSLRSLKLTVELDPEMEDHPGKTRDDQQLFALQQISRLTQLEYISFNGDLSHGELGSMVPASLVLISGFAEYGRRRDQPQFNLDLLLSRGLNLLSTLSNLKAFELPRSKVWGFEEKEWAREHWPKLDVRRRCELGYFLMEWPS
ncbi:hypothetical protein BGZ72_002462 [Mortierella alpina]|nr:hypothetical protein BGZ72_002462 [Mortierella alpina]